MIEALKWLSAALVSLSLAACSAKTTPSVRDSNSNWLATCDITADCDGDGACICGLCTATCGDDDDCESAGPNATCVRPGEASGEVACAAIVESAGENVCLGECADDDDCREGSSCESGACWAKPSSVIDRRDSGTEPPAPDAEVEMMPPLDVSIPAEIWALDASVDFAEPTPRPMPATELQGAEVASLIGTWNELVGTHQYWGSPMKLTIAEDPATARITGTIVFSCQAPCDFPSGPFPEPTDPDALYPPMVDPLEYSNLLLNVVPAVPYRVFDGRLQDGRLALWFTTNDVWSAWCGLQTPSPVNVDGLPRYACMPDARPFEEVITDAVAGEPVGKGLLCASDRSPCSCTAAACAVDYHGAVSALSLELTADGTLRGFYLPLNETYAVTLERQVMP